MLARLMCVYNICICFNYMKTCSPVIYKHLIDVHLFRSTHDVWIYACMCMICVFLFIYTYRFTLRLNSSSSFKFLHFSISFIKVFTSSTEIPTSLICSTDEETWWIKWYTKDVLQTSKRLDRLIWSLRHCDKPSSLYRGWQCNLCKYNM